MRFLLAVPAFVSWLILAVPVMADLEAPLAGPVDLEFLGQTGEDWEILSQDLDTEAGHVALHHDKWLMYFLHWRPLTEENRELSVEFVRDLLLTFWGPSMPFELTGEQGTLEVGGHDAYWVQAILPGPAVHTRFIVWNCPESNRQLIADTNINRRLGTDPDWLEVQRDITLTIACHGQEVSGENPLLGQHYVSAPLNLSFWIPGTWHTDEFPSHTYYPDGLSGTDGSLWTLPTDSGKHLELHWRTDSRAVSADLLTEFLESLNTETAPPDSLIAWSDSLQLDKVWQEDQRVVAAGNFKYHTRAGGQDDNEWYRYRAVMWREETQVKLLLMGLVAMQDIWGTFKDLTPSEAIFERFVTEQCWPAIR